MNLAGLYSEFWFTCALTVQIGLAVPVVLYLGSSAASRSPLHRKLLVPIIILSVILTSYLAGALDFRATKRGNNLDFLLASLSLIALLGYNLHRWGTSALADSRDRPNGTGVAAQVEVTKSSSDYAALILSMQASATREDRMAKRLSTVFKDPEEVRAIAEQRFGPASEHVKAYVDEHRERRRLFLERMSNNELVCREIYNVSDLAEYFSLRRHAGNVEIARNQLRKTVEEWLRVLKEYQNYYVGLTDEPTPFKYQIYNGTSAIIHESVGSLDGQRLNSLRVSETIAVDAFSSDFSTVWDRIPRKMRDRGEVGRYVRAELLPLLEEPGGGEVALRHR